ncbi:MAG: TetR family transcriptional regulator [Mycobacterium sp.]|jgi:AcrR family transcriptional regulator|nr:TetR family transcriptional regulator [Mycobacterium sp.]
MRSGRPREFDVDEVLDRAMRVFWQHGYEGAAMSGLTSAMGINRPSLYAAYGNKESLFGQVLERYSEQVAGYAWEALEQPTVREVVEHLLRGAVQATTSRGRPKGCLTVQGALACGPDGEVARAELAQWRHAAEGTMRARLRRGQQEGDLPETADPAELARYVATMVQGISVQAAGGTSRAALLRTVEMTMVAWDALTAA